MNYGILKKKLNLFSKNPWSSLELAHGPGLGVSTAGKLTDGLKLADIPPDQIGLLAYMM